MSKYSNWVKANSNHTKYQYWTDNHTYVRGAYDNTTGEGIEQVYKLADEYEIDRSEELLEDARLYME